MEPLQLAGAITGGLAAVTAIGVAGRFVLRMGRNVTDLHDDWRGEPDRPGVPGRPGVMERLAALEAGQVATNKELHPNGGSSLRDAVNRVETKLHGVEVKLDDHVTSHAQQPVQVNVGMPPTPIAS